MIMLLFINIETLRSVQAESERKVEIFQLLIFVQTESGWKKINKKRSSFAFSLNRP